MRLVFDFQHAQGVFRLPSRISTKSAHHTHATSHQKIDSHLLRRWQPLHFVFVVALSLPPSWTEAAAAVVVAVFAMRNKNTNQQVYILYSISSILSGSNSVWRMWQTSLRLVLMIRTLPTCAYALPSTLVPTTSSG
jgi:hypothetical protein